MSLPDPPASSATRLASITFDEGLPSQVSATKGMKRQPFLFADLSLQSRGVLILPLGTDLERMFVVSTMSPEVPRARIVGALDSYLLSGDVAAPFRSMSVGTSGRIYLVYTTNPLEVTLDEVFTLQAYQVSLIQGRSQPSASSGSLIQRFGSISAGGASLPVTGVTSASNVAGDILVLTASTSRVAVNPIINGQNTIIPGAMLGQAADLSATSPFSYVVFTPITESGMITSPPSASLSSFQFNGQSYRPGDRYPDDQRLAKIVTIQGTDYLVTPPGAGV